MNLLRRLLLILENDGVYKAIRSVNICLFLFLELFSHFPSPFQIQTSLPMTVASRSGGFFTRSQRNYTRKALLRCYHCSSPFRPVCVRPCLSSLARTLNCVLLSLAVTKVDKSSSLQACESQVSCVSQSSPSLQSFWVPIGSAGEAEALSSRSASL